MVCARVLPSLILPSVLARSSAMTLDTLYPPCVTMRVRCSLKAPIAMGYVTPTFAETGKAVEVEVRGKRQGATVAKMPFVPHNYFKAPKA